MAQWLFVEWLLVWILETSRFEFEWDSANRTKNKVKHDVSEREVEEVFLMGTALPLGEQIEPPVNEQRLGIVGTTAEGRILQVVFTMRNGKVRPVSARPAHKKERKQYASLLRKVSERIR